MPIHYEGIQAEHGAVRGSVGVFDVSHMGEIETTGPGAEAFLQRSSPTTWPRSPSAARSTRSSAAQDGGVLDDLFTYRLGEGRFLTVTNAANHARDVAWFRGRRRARGRGQRRRRATGRCSPCRGRGPGPC